MRIYKEVWLIIQTFILNWYIHFQQNQNKNCVFIVIYSRLPKIYNLKTINMIINFIKFLNG